VEGYRQAETPTVGLPGGMVAAAAAGSAIDATPDAGPQ